MNKKIKTESVDYLFDAILNLKNKDECYNFFEDLINDIRTWILNNPNVPINNIVLP